MQPFHLAFPVTDLAATRTFYEGLLGCVVGRTAARWIDFNFFGHQVSAHLVEVMPVHASNAVDGDSVPTTHWGAVLLWDEWHAFADRLREAGVLFLVEPRIRFAGQVGEQATLFLRDPSGNALEFKSVKDPGRLFATE